MRRLLSALSLVIVSAAFATPPPYPSAEADQKRFVMEFRQNDGRVAGVELLIAHPGDEALSPVQLLEKQVGLKWSGFSGGTVYRFDQHSKTWEPVMTRDMSSTETRIWPLSGVKISELRSGDILILYPPSP